MPNRISVASVIEKNKIGSDVPYLCFLQVGIIEPTTGGQTGTLYYVNNTEDVTYQGVLYTAIAFDIELNDELGAQPQITLTIQDFTRAVLTTMYAYDGGVGFPVTFLVAQAGSLDQAPDVQEFFEITSAQAANYVITWMLGAESGLTRTFPKRQQRKDFCQWIYRDQTTCRYSGNIPNCDRTLAGGNGCAAHQNAVNFGGMPNLVSANSITR
jgi:phage-related protein